MIVIWYDDWRSLRLKGSKIKWNQSGGLHQRESPQKHNLQFVFIIIIGTNTGEMHSLQNMDQPERALERRIHMHQMLLYFTPQELRSQVTALEEQLANLAEVKHLANQPYKRYVCLREGSPRHWQTAAMYKYAEEERKEEPTLQKQSKSCKPPSRNQTQIQTLYNTVSQRGMDHQEWQGKRQQTWAHKCIPHGEQGRHIRQGQGNTTPYCNTGTKENQKGEVVAARILSTFIHLYNFHKYICICILPSMFVLFCYAKWCLGECARNVNSFLRGLLATI